MDVFADRLLHDDAVQDNAEEGGPHIEEIQAVEAMGHDEHVTRQNGGVGLGTAQKDDQIGQKAADGGVQEGASQASQGEVIRHEAAGGGQDAEQVIQKIPFPGIQDGDRGSRQEKEADKQWIRIYEPLTQGMLGHRVSD